MRSLITAEELVARLAEVRLLDARSGEAGRRAYGESRLRGALHADLETHLSAPPADAADGGRHPLPDVGSWARQLGEWGIGPATPVVIYDDRGGANAAARCWWMLRAAGHDAVAVLDGGFEAAVEAGVPVASGSEPPPRPAPPYPVSAWRLPLVSAEEVDARRHDSRWRVVDVRDEFRFRGESDPYDPVPGHIPGAANLPYRHNLDDGGRFKSAQELEAHFAGVLAGTPAERVIVHCGSGVTACHTLLAMERAGLAGARLYVGSWSEWCRRGWPVAKGEE